MTPPHLDGPDKRGTREFFGVTLNEPQFPGEASLYEWLQEQMGVLQRAVDLDVAVACVHAWLTSYAEARCDLLEALAELEQK